MDAEASKLAETSSDSVSSAFDHFSVPPTQTSVSRGKHELIQPTAGGSKTGKLEFIVPKADGVYTDLANSFFEFDVRVFKADNTNLSGTAADVHVWPDENLAHSLFEKVTVAINDQDVEYFSNYNVWAYVHNRLNYDKGTLNSTLRATSGWFAEDDDIARDTDERTVAHIARRKGLVSSSKTLSFCTRLRSSFLTNELYLFPGSKVTITLSRADVSVALSGDADAPAGGAVISIETASFYAYRLKANASLLNAQVERVLGGDRVKYPERRVKTRVHLLVKGETSASIPLAETSQRPSRVLLAMTHADAATGHFAKSAYKFEPFDVTSISCNVEGLGDSIEYRTNFTSGQGLSRPYCELAKLVGRFESDHAFPVTFDEWKTRTTIWPFDLSEDKNRNGSTLQLVKRGRLSFNIRFGTPLPENVSVHIITEQDDIIETGLDNRITTRVPVL